MTNTISSIPAATHSSTISWMLGTSTSGSNSLGTTLVTGRKRVPRPATGSTALRTLRPRLSVIFEPSFYARFHPAPRGSAGAGPDWLVGACGEAPGPVVTGAEAPGPGAGAGRLT